MERPHRNDAEEVDLVLTVLRAITRRWTTTTQIFHALEAQGHPIPRRQLQRVLKKIVETPGLNVEMDARTKPHAYRQQLPNSSLSTHYLRPQECLVLRLCEEHMRHLLPSTLLHNMEPLFETARMSLNERGAATPESAWLSKVASAPSSVHFLPPEIKPRIFDAVSEALFREVKLEVSYRNLNGEHRQHIVSPLGLVEQDHKVYLVVRFDGYDNCRHLALHRILDAQVLSYAADIPPDFSLPNYVNARHFNYSNGGKVRLVLEFQSDETALLLQETPFSRDQKLVKAEDGFWHLEAVTDDTVLLKGWIASWPEGHFRKVERTPIPDPTDED